MILNVESLGLIKHSPDEALAFLLAQNFSKQQYCEMKAACASANANIWPNYNQVREAKKNCRPEGVCYGETEVVVSLQALLDHTTKRLLEKVTN